MLEKLTNIYIVVTCSIGTIFFIYLIIGFAGTIYKEFKNKRNV